MIELAEKIVNEISKTDNDYDAKDVVIAILNDYEQSQSKQFKEGNYEKI